MSERSSPRWAPFALGGIVVLVALLLWTQSLKVGLWTNDEDYFVQIARLLTEHLPSSIVDLPVAPFDDRGIQRLHVLVLSVPLGTINGETGMAVARALMCLAFASAAVPAYALARGIRLAPGWALLAALLVAVLPWAVLSLSLLSENVTYPLVLWAVWGAWRACVVPGVRSDLLAVGLAVLAALARTNMIVLVGVAPLALAIVTAAAAARDRAPRRHVARMLREHPLLSLVLVVGTALFVLSVAGAEPPVLSGLAGTYLTSLSLTAYTFEKAGGQLAALILGLAIVPVLLALPWLGGRLVRTDAPREQALAAASVATVLLLLVSTIYAADEERYVFYLAALVVVPAVAALARRSVPWWSPLAVAVPIAFLVGGQPWIGVPETGRFVTYSAHTFVTEVVLNNVARVLPGDPRDWVTVAVPVAGVVAAAALWPRLPRRAALVVAALIAVALVVETRWLVATYALRSAGPVDQAERTWLDDSVPGDAPVALQATGMGNAGDYIPIWRELVFWNRQAEMMLSTEPLAGVQVPRYGGHQILEIDDRTGRAQRADRLPMPRYNVAPALFRRVGLDARFVRQSKYLPLILERLRSPVRAVYRWNGPEFDGWLTAAAPAADLELFPAAFESAPRPCVRFRIVAPAELRGARRYEVRVGDRRVSGSLRGAEAEPISLPLRRGERSVRVHALSADRGGRKLALQVADTTVGRCDAS